MLNRFIVFSLFCLTCNLHSFAQPIDFSHEVVPILRKHCCECHAGREAKGSFSLNTRSLLVESGHVSLERPADSRLLALVRSTTVDEQMPPADKPRLTAAEIAILEKWIATELTWESGFSFAPKTYEPPLQPRRPTLPPVIDERENPLDRILDNWLVAQAMPRPASIDDATFLRRVRLDITGLLPEPNELTGFLADRTPDKRARKIQTLLDDKLAYADHWLSFYNDLLRNDYSGTGFITGGRKQISGWLYKALLDNQAFDSLARELIAPTSPESQGFIDGIRWRGEVSAGQTVEIQFAQSVAQSFLGINLKCASCHDSFVDRWKLDEAYGLAAIYSERTLDIHRCDKPVGRTAQASWLFPELGQVDAQAPRAERLQQLAELMTAPGNGRFARTIANRLWYRLMGRGIVHPLDAMQTEPWNADLLDYLAVFLVDQKFDVKQVLALIANSRAYQSQGEVVHEAKETTYLYSGPRSRRLTAEQFLDAIWQITGTAPTKFDAPIFREVKENLGSETAQSSAASILGNSEVDPPQAGETIELRQDSSGAAPMIRAALLKNTALMRSLGRPMREQIVSMRPTELTTLEAIDLANEAELSKAFAEGAVKLVEKFEGDAPRLVEFMFEFALSRQPTPKEAEMLVASLGTPATPPAVQDALWAICMLPEFWLVQ